MHETIMDVYTARRVSLPFSRGAQRVFTAHNVHICNDGFHVIARVPADLSVF